MLVERSCSFSPQKIWLPSTTPKSRTHVGSPKQWWVSMLIEDCSFRVLNGLLVVNEDCKVGSEKGLPMAMILQLPGPKWTAGGQ